MRGRLLKSAHCWGAEMKNAQLPLIAEPSAAQAQFSPTLPHHATRRAAILEALRRGERLTQGDTLQRGQGWRLAADIFALKHNHGWPIESLMIGQGEGRNPIALYWLPAEVQS